MRNILFILLVFLIVSCSTEKTDSDITIIRNANIYNQDYTSYSNQSLAIENGKIIAIDSFENLEKNYNAKEVIDIESAFLFPGFNDAHCHFYGYATNLAQYCDLKETKSFDEIIERLISYDEKYSPEFLCGRGWDQNDWENTNMPNWDKLNEVFPDKPIYLVRIDGHAAIANEEAFKMADITNETIVTGGEITISNGQLTGLLIDNAMSLVRRKIPSPTYEQITDALLMAQDSCLKYGLTSLTDAGLGENQIILIDSLQKSGDLKIRINVMMSPSEENFKYFETEFKETEKLKITAVKLFADGALGSRGACLLSDYSDDSGNKGFIIDDIEYYKEICQYAYDHNLQVCTHCIGDSANRLMLDIYSGFLKGENDRRWRIEHAQVVNKDDMHKFKDFSIIPSIQSTHATSDMYWAENRLGSERINDAYQTKRLLEQNGWLTNGTDFPIERIPPLETFYAAVSRQDKDLYPDDGFLSSQKLTRQEAIMSITYWPAKASFKEDVKGKIEVGMNADFVILDKNIIECSPDEILQTQILEVWIGGAKVKYNIFKPQVLSIKAI